MQDSHEKYEDYVSCCGSVVRSPRADLLECQRGLFLDLRRHAFGAARVGRDRGRSSDWPMRIERAKRFPDHFLAGRDEQDWLAFRDGGFLGDGPIHDCAGNIGAHFPALVAGFYVSDHRAGIYGFAGLEALAENAGDGRDDCGRREHGQDDCGGPELSPKRTSESAALRATMGSASASILRRAS